MMPSAIENLNFTVKNYASLSQSRLFLPLDKQTFLLKKIEKRKTDIIIRRGYIETDTVYYSFPAGYKPEILPESVNYSSIYGEYHSETFFPEEK
jgi:hypothetical protein